MPGKNINILWTKQISFRNTYLKRKKNITPQLELEGAITMQIEDIFKKNSLNFQKVDISHITLFKPYPEKVTNYLKCMGKEIKLHRTEHGGAWTTLYNVNDIISSQEPICSEKNLLIIGNGLNGDLLTINLKNNHAGYIFHDDLYEENYTSIEEIYCELSFDIETFIEIALESETYPIDGTMAEQMKSIFQ